MEKNIKEDETRLVETNDYITTAYGSIHYYRCEKCGCDELLDNDNTNPNIIKDVVFKTKTQETEAIDFNSIELREDNYRFPISREKVDNENLNQLASQSYLGRMRGKYLICDYTFDCNNNREFKLPYIKTTYRYSML